MDANDRLEISRFMRAVAGEFARAYNRRKERSNAFWGDNFHATLVESGDWPLHFGDFLAVVARVAPVEMPPSTSNVWPVM
jgi:hypothetical protein